jgi:hypothetical protein
VAVSGNATFTGGSINISLINGFDPSILDSFQIMTFAGKTGNVTVNGTHYSPTERLYVVNNATSITLVNSFVGDFNIDGVVNALDIDQLNANLGGGNLDLYDLDGNSLLNSGDVSFLLNNILHRRPGDANLNGNVDAADLAALRSNLGTGNVSWANGNFDGDNDIDAADLALFRSNLGLPPPGFDGFAGDTGGFNGVGLLLGNGSGSSVPEPGALGLLAIGGLTLLRRRR